jgi:hypothetical protein
LDIGGTKYKAFVFVSANKKIIIKDDLNKNIEGNIQCIFHKEIRQLILLFIFCFSYIYIIYWLTSTTISVLN